MEEELTLFGDLDEFTIWRKEWKDMPEFIQKDLEPEIQIIVSFKNYKDVQEFGKLINQQLTPKTRSIWFPEVKIGNVADLRWMDNIERGEL